MIFNYSNHTNSNDSNRVGKRRNNYGVLGALTVIGVVIWLTGGNRESPCLGGLCLFAALEQSSSPRVSGFGRTAVEGINRDIAELTRATEPLGVGHELETRSVLRARLNSQGRKRNDAR